MTIPVLFAGAFRVNEENSLRALIPMGSNVSQFAIYFGALLGVGLLAFASALLVYGRRHRRHSRHHHSGSVSGRRSRPALMSRPRTLTGTGGLPPIRTN